MSYRYEDLKPWLFSDEGQRKFLEVRDRACELLVAAGAFRLDMVANEVTGDTWGTLACIDRLEELEEILMVYSEGATQHRVYVRGKRAKQ